MLNEHTHSLMHLLARYFCPGVCTHMPPETPRDTGEAYFGAPASVSASSESSTAAAAAAAESLPDDDTTTHNDQVRLLLFNNF